MLCRFLIAYWIPPGRFSPQLKVLNYSGGKEAREEEKAKIVNAVSSQEWDRAKFPFHILLAHYEVWFDSPL